MAPHGITGPPDQSSRNSGNFVNSIGQTPNAAKFCCAPTNSVRDIPCSQPRWASAFTCSLPLCFSRWRIKFIHSLWKNFAPWKGRPKFTPGYQICHQSIGLGVHEFLQTLCSNFGSRLLRFRDIAGFVQQMHFCTYFFVFHPQFRDVPLELDR